VYLCYFSGLDVGNSSCANFTCILTYTRRQTSYTRTHKRPLSPSPPPSPPPPVEPTDSASLMIMQGMPTPQCTVFASFFRKGQVFEAFRGTGVYQPAVDLAIEKLRAGAWVRIFVSCRQSFSSRTTTTHILPRSIYLSYNERASFFYISIFYIHFH